LNRSLPPGARGLATIVGFLVVVGIMLWALSNDFLRLLGI